MNTTEYKPELLTAIKAFRDSKPWRGTLAERKQKFTKLNAALARAYERPLELQFHELDETAERGNGGVMLNTEGVETIVLVSKLSVVTYLHVFSRAVLGFDQQAACDWSIQLYEHFFPRSAARMTTEGHLIVAPSPSRN